jgi:hypothetical protein
MNIRRSVFWLLVCVAISLGLMVVMLGGCENGNGSTQGGVISEVTMASALDSEERPLEPTSVFAPDAEVIYCSLKLTGFSPDTMIVAEWIYVKGEQVGIGAMEENTVFQTNVGTPEGDGYTSISLQRPEDYKEVPWPKGEYKIVFSVDNEEKASVSFTVE